MIDLPRFYPNLTDATPFNPLLHPLTLGFSEFCYNFIKRALLIAFVKLFLTLVCPLTLPQGRKKRIFKDQRITIKLQIH
jgi:hypothetical protein